MIESLEPRRLFAVALPVARVVLPLTPANEAANAPTITVPAAAAEAAGDALDEALDHFPDLG